jgi:hypothetical protein
MGLKKEQEEIQREMTPAETFEAGILKNVIRETWHGDSRSKGAGDKQLMWQLDLHANNMRSILNSLDYEISAMPMVASNTAKMNKDEVRAYLTHLETMASGYANLLGKDLTNVLMIGISRKANSLQSLTYYTSLLFDRIEKRQSACAKRVARENSGIERVSREIALHNSSLISKLFRKRRMATLSKSMTVRNRRAGRLLGKEARYAALLSRLKAQLTER